MFQFSSFLLFFFLSFAIVRSAVEPAPIVVAATGKFSGNDGSWSTFNFSVGTPPQTLEVIPSTQVPESWIILDVACANSPTNCSDTRGGTFAYQDSSSWTNKSDESFFALGAEANLGYTREENRGFFGWEMVQLTTPEGAKVTTNRSVVAGIVTRNFYVGVLGLAARPVVWEDHSDSSPSLIAGLKEQRLIPNLSYGYTAGASYKNAPGSLTIGGYDTSRLTPNDVLFGFSSQTARQLLVFIQGISVTNSNGPDQLLSQSFSALIDSTVPQMWLPEAVCKAFEEAFGIEWDPITNLYLVNNDQHDAMVKQNAEVTIRLGTSLNGGDTASITLPYASFDLEIGPPFVKSQRKYFPLRRAKDETQTTLGRAFLQEAFIIADYDNNRFSISQAQYSQGQPSRIVVTSAEQNNGNSDNTDSTPETPAVTRTTPQKSGGIGTGAIAGIAVAIVVLVLLAGGFCFCWFKKRRSSKTKDNTKGKAELEDNSEPKGVTEAYNKRRPSQESSYDSKHAAKHHENEIPQTPTAAELEGAPERTAASRSMSMEQIGAAELPSPDPFRPELESPGLGLIRSELSTPEPSELSTSDRNLVHELTAKELAHEMTSQEIPHELSSDKRKSHVRPTSYRENSIDSDIISPQDSASLRPRLRDRKGSDDTIPTPASPIPQRPNLRLGPRRNSGRPTHIRLNSSSSIDTFQTRFDQSAPTLPGDNTSYLPASHPLELHGARSNSFRTAPGSPSPLASPPLGSSPSPALSALNSPTFSASNLRMADNGPPTPNHLDLSTMSGETEPLMRGHQQGSPRSTRFAENFTSDPQEMAGEERERERDRRRDTEPRVKSEVEKIEDRSKREGK